MNEQWAEGLTFWPEKRIHHAFQEARRGLKAGDELKALRIFHRRMEYFLKTSTGTGISDNQNRECFVAAHYERPLLEKDIAAISGPTGKRVAYPAPQDYNINPERKTPEAFLTEEKVLRVCAKLNFLSAAIRPGEGVEIGRLGDDEANGFSLILEDLAEEIYSGTDDEGGGGP